MPSRCLGETIRQARALRLPTLAALLFAVLQRGGVPVDAFTQLVSKDIVQILQALVILFVAAEAMFRRTAVGKI